MKTNFIFIAAIGGFLSVAIGAFGAHAVKNILSEYSLHIYQTGVLYQSIHSLALLAIGILIQQNSNTKLIKAGWFFIIGILLFSGSLYALALTNIKLLGIITPFGGISLMLGWILLALASLKPNH